MTNVIQGFPQNDLKLGSGASSPLKTGEGGSSDFMQTLKDAMGQVGEMQADADGKVAQLATGTGQDVHSAMIAVEEANLSFQMMVQVRNKILQAYQQVSGMQF
jgi:flagellar hook-basal body complex protein FliE